MKKKSIIVVGAGIIGMTTAELLCQKGYTVTVVEAENQAGEGTSYANASLLSWAFCLPFGSPSLIKGLARQLMDPTSGVKISPAAAVKHVEWGVAFLNQCRAENSAINLKNLLLFATQSSLALDKVMKRTKVKFDYRSPGKISLIEKQDALDKASHTLSTRRILGLKVEALSREECIEKEPQLQHSEMQFAGGIYAPDSGVGDCAKFTLSLAEYIRRKFKAVFHYNFRVDSLIVRGGKIAGVARGKDIIMADGVVLAMGANSLNFVSDFEGRQPIAPIRGFSVTLPLKKGAPEMSFSDGARGIAFCRLGDKYRVTGAAELNDVKKIDKAKIARILDVARRWLPDAADYDCADNDAWCGIRPSTPSTMPMIAKAGKPGLYINAGHGYLGWTLSAGSAERMVEIIERDF